MKYIVVGSCLVMIGYAFYIIIRSFTKKSSQCKHGCDGCQKPCTLDGDALCRYRDDQKNKQ